MVFSIFECQNDVHFVLSTVALLFSWPIKGLSVNPRLICANDLTLNSSSPRSSFPWCCLFSKVLTRSLPSPSCDLRFYFSFSPDSSFSCIATWSCDGMVMTQDRTLNCRSTSYKCVKLLQGSYIYTLLLCVRVERMSLYRHIIVLLAPTHYTPPSF